MSTNVKIFHNSKYRKCHLAMDIFRELCTMWIFRRSKAKMTKKTQLTRSLSLRDPVLFGHF